MTITTKRSMTDLQNVTVIEVFTADQLNALDGEEYTLTVGARPDISRQPQPDGTVPPSQPGDVLSVQTDGTLQTRAEGTAGNFERCVKSGSFLVYRPVGTEGRTFVVPFAPNAPNKS